MIHIRAKHAIGVGAVLAVATVGEVVGWTHDQSMPVGTSFLGIGLIVGAPLSLPWLVMLAMERKPRERILDVGESALYGLIVVYQLALLFILPKVLSDSEGFAAFYLWGIGCVATIFLVIFNATRGRRSAMARSAARGEQHQTPGDEEGADEDQ
jgi:hypothetical protein